MVAQVILSPESFIADVAYVRSLVGMGALVNEKVVTLGKMSVNHNDCSNNAL